MDFIGDYRTGSVCRCGKKCYTKADANAWLNNLKKHHCTASHIGKGGNVPKRAYYCELCGMYHLTHLKYSIDYTDGGHKPNKQEFQGKNADFNSKVFSTIKKGNIDISDFDID